MFGAGGFGYFLTDFKYSSASLSAGPDVQPTVLRRRGPRAGPFGCFILLGSRPLGRSPRRCPALAAIRCCGAASPSLRFTLASGPESAPHSSARWAFGRPRSSVRRTDAVNDFLPDVGIVLRHFQDGGVLLDRRTLIGDGPRQGVDGFAGDAFLLRFLRRSHPPLIVLLDAGHALDRGRLRVELFIRDARRRRLRLGNLGGRLGLILRVRHGEEELPRADRSSGCESPRQQSHRLSPFDFVAGGLRASRARRKCSKNAALHGKGQCRGQIAGAVEVPAISATLICGEYRSRRAGPPFCARSGSAA